MTTALSHRLALGLTCAALAAAGATSIVPTALAQSTSPATVSIGNCHVKRSNGFTWFFCAVTSNAPGTVVVNYTVNLTTFKPSVGGTWLSRSGTLRFPGGGQQLRNIKLAVRNLSTTQVRKRLRVTLSKASGATITDATAVASGS